VSGILSDDPGELRRCAERLLSDRTVAEEMGRAAKRTVVERFSPAAFRAGLLRSIAQARAKFEG
jgi:hypothetical protein